VLDCQHPVATAVKRKEIETRQGGQRVKAVERVENAGGGTSGEVVRADPTAYGARSRLASETERRVSCSHREAAFAAAGASGGAGKGCP